MRFSYLYQNYKIFTLRGFNCRDMGQPQFDQELILRPLWKSQKVGNNPLYGITVLISTT